VQVLLRGQRAATSCEARRAAIATYLQSGDNRREQNVGLRSLHISDADLRDRLSSLVAILEDDREGAARITKLAEQISATESLRPQDQQAELSRQRDTLLRLSRNPKERFTARVGAPFLLTRVLRAGDKDHPDWVPEWRKESLGMLQGPDDELRIVAAVNATLGRLPEGSDPRGSDIARALIGGLRHASPSIREMSHTGLGQITRSGPCFEATDPPILRASAVRDWEAWWKQNEAKLDSPIHQVFR
jgi:hypothetical protein